MAKRASIWEEKMDPLLKKIVIGMGFNFLLRT